MKISSFVEGVRPETGGIGIPGAPFISKAVAEQGNHVELHIGGQPMPVVNDWMAQGAVSSSFATVDSAFVVVTYPAISRWAFAPTLLARSRRRIRDVDFIMLHSLYSFPVLAGYLIARKHNIPYALWLHGVLAPIQREVSRRKKAVYDKIIARRIIEHASMLVCTARRERDEIQPLGLKARSVIIPNGVSIDEYASLPKRGEFRAKFLAGHDGPLVIYLGRLTLKKRLDLVVRAMAHVVEHVPQAYLAIVGPGDPPSYTVQVQTWIRENGLARSAVLTGPILDLKEKKQALADADVFVLPSQAENFALAMFEAMASGVPVVITDTLGFSDEVRRSKAGIVVQSDAEELAAGILKLVTDSDLRQQMGNNARRLAQAYSWERTGQKVVRAMQCILQAQPLPPDLMPEQWT